MAARRKKLPRVPFMPGDLIYCDGSYVHPVTRVVRVSLVTRQLGNQLVLCWDVASGIRLADDLLHNYVPVGGEAESVVRLATDDEIEDARFEGFFPNPLLAPPEAAERFAG